MGLFTPNESRISSSSSIVVSPDFKWLAASTKTRGATWNLESNTRMHSLRGFRGGWFADEHSFYADFPKFGNQERAIVKLDPSNNSPRADTVYSVGKLIASQFDRYLIVTSPDAKNSGDKNWTFELRDYLANNTVWSRKFDREYPAGSWDSDSGTVLFWWEAWKSAAKDEMKQYPEYKASAEDADYFFEVLDFKKNIVTKKLLLKTNKGSFRVKGASFDGDWLAVTTKDDRVITYSLSSGKEIGHVFGFAPMLSATGNVLAVPLSETILNIYDLSTTEFRTRLKFGTHVIYRAFSADGRRLFVLTSDQTAYIIDLSAPSNPVPGVALEKEAR